MLLVADNSAHTNISVDGTGDIAALIDGAGDVFSITAGGKAVVVSGTTELFAMVSVHVNTICLHCCGASTIIEYDHVYT